jgi:hypothetical protein
MIQMTLIAYQASNSKKIKLAELNPEISEFNQGPIACILLEFL